MAEIDDKKENGEIAEQAANPPVEEAPAAEVAAETPPKHKYADRLSKAYPDRKFEKDEDYDAAMDEHLTDLEGYKERGKAANQKLIALFEAEPQVAEVVRDMIAGATFREALARHISPEDLTAIEGDPDYEGWNKNATDRMARLDKRKKDDEDFSNNISLSDAEITAFATKNEMTEESVQELLGKIDALFQDFKHGKVTQEALDRMQKAFSYEQALKEAKETGEIAGRNTSISEARAADTKVGDGMPKIASSGEIKEPEPKQSDPLGDLVNKVKSQRVL